MTPKAARRLPYDQLIHFLPSRRIGQLRRLATVRPLSSAESAELDEHVETADAIFRERQRRDCARRGLG
jgi:hypothetical protein